MKGYTAEVVARLQPYLVALPEPTPININTADAVLLAALDANLGLSDGEALVEARGEDGFKSVDSFKDQPALNAKQVDDSLLSVETQWFLMVSQADIGQGRARLASLIQRPIYQILVLQELQLPKYKIFHRKGAIHCQFRY